jgi:hypothetical protein
MYCAVLSKDIVRPDDHAASARFGQVLGFAPNDRSFTDYVVAPDASVVFDHAPSGNLAAIANLDSALNNGEWSNNNVRAQSSVGVHKSSGVNLMHGSDPSRGC